MAPLPREGEGRGEGAVAVRELFGLGALGWENKRVVTYAPEHKESTRQVLARRGLRQRAATPITSQVPVRRSHDLIGEATHTDAICDRFIHTAYVIELQGSSLRETPAHAQ